MAKLAEGLAKNHENIKVLRRKGMTDLYFIALERISKLDKSKDNIIRFPKIFEKLCPTFYITKKNC